MPKLRFSDIFVLGQRSDIAHTQNSITSERVVQLVGLKCIHGHGRLCYTDTNYHKLCFYKIWLKFACLLSIFIPADNRDPRVKGIYVSIDILTIN
jgi:hypothetical protein